MPIKVLDISFYHNPISSRPYAEIFIGLQKAGVEVSVMARGDTYYAKRFAENGLNVIDFQISKKFSLKAIRLIRNEIRKNNIQVLQLGSSKGIINGLFAAMGLKVKVVLYRGYTGNIHWYDPSAYLKFLHPRVDRILCIAEATRDHIRQNMLFNRQKAITIRKGHDPAWYAEIVAADLSEFGIGKGDFSAICVANVRPMKDIPNLIRATRYLPSNMPFHLFLVGNGMEAPEIQQEIQASPFKDHIHLTGFRKDVLEIVKACDVFTLASIKGEAITKAVIEAMSLASTPIITDIPGNKALVKDGEHGLVVPPKDPQAMAAAIVKLWENQELCKRYGQNAQKHIQTNFHIEQSIRETHQMYKELVEE